MKRICFLGLIMLLLCSACHASRTGKIVDAETGKPIEGAILLVEWIKGHGIGLTYHTSAKAIEIFSNKDGMVIIPSYFNPFVEGPYITIYKPGYVAWNNNWIFPGYRKRSDFNLSDGYVFKLESFKSEYRYVDHEEFVMSCIHSGLENNNKKLLEKIYLQSENPAIRKELDKKLERKYDQ